MLIHSTWFCTAANLPGISQMPVMRETPFSATWHHGDKMNFEELTITFMVDEDIRAWQELYIWIRGLTFPNVREEYSAQVKRGLYADATLHVYKNSMVQNVWFKFLRCFPISLSPLMFNTSDDASIPVTADCTFRYDTFEIVRTTS